MRCRVVFMLHDRGQIELLGQFAGHGDTQDSAAQFEHQVNGFRRDQFGRANEIAFIFALFRVDHDHQLSGAETRECRVDGVESGGGLKCGARHDCLIRLWSG